MDTHGPSAPDPESRPPRAGPLAADARMEPLLFPFADEAVVTRIQRGYLRHFAGARSVLDVGSGRGIFLKLLREAGVTGIGVDANEAAAVRVREAGFRVVSGDACSAVLRLADAGERFGGVFCSHLVEHLTPPELLDLLRSLVRVLEPGGRMVIVTPNPRCPEVIGHAFWLDPTHVRPYPRELLERAAAAAGLVTVESFDDPATRPGARIDRRVRGFFAALLLGVDPRPPMDSVVVLRRA